MRPNVSQIVYFYIRRHYTRREQSCCCLVSRTFWVLCPSLGSADPGASYPSPAERKEHIKILNYLWRLDVEKVKTV